MINLSGVNLKGVTIFPKTEKAVSVCQHKYGAVATWSHCTDTIQTAYARGEINAFKNNLQVTGFINPWWPIVDVQASFATGRTAYGIYFPTDRWFNPLATEGSSSSVKYQLIPDFNSATWTQAGVTAGLVTSDKIGTAKDLSYPQHGQQMFDLTGGLYGYDLINNIAGQIDVLSGLIEYLKGWFYWLLGYYPSCASYGYGRETGAYGMYDFYIASRTSTYDYTYDYNLTHQSAIQLPTTTRQYDMVADLGISVAASQAICVDKLTDSIATGGWYRDFTHWHSSGSTLTTFFATQRAEMGASDVVTLDYGSAVEYMVLRDMVRRVSLYTYNSTLVLVVDIKNEDEIPLTTINVDLSVEIDTTGTILEGKEITSSVPIRKLGTNSFIIEVPYYKKDGFPSVVLEETEFTDYMDFELPSIVSAAVEDNTLTVVTDKPTNLVLYSTAIDGALYTAVVLKRNSIMATTHIVDVTGIDFSTKDCYIGVITPEKQSILSVKYSF